MSLHTLIEEGEAWIAKLKSHLSASTRADIKDVQNAGHEIVADAVSYIKVNGLHDLEQLALTLVAAMVPGASWVATLATIKSQAIADGIAIIDGAEAVVAAKVQADLLAAGKAAGLPAA